MTPQHELDSVLSYLNNDEQYQETVDKINKRTGSKMSDKRMTQILEKLRKDGYANNSFLKVGGVEDSNRKTYYLSFEGLIFQSKGGYVEEFKKERRKKQWDYIAKLMSIVALLVGIGSMLGIGKLLISSGTDKNQSITHDTIYLPDSLLKKK